jgi:hypothetical protein
MGMRPQERNVLQITLQSAQVVTRVGHSMVLLVRQTRVLVPTEMQPLVQSALRTTLQFAEVATLDGLSLAALVRPPPPQPQLFSLDTT